MPIKYMMEPSTIITIIIHRYGVFRRSALNTLYHPYYVDYGRDKIEFFHRLIAESLIVFVDSIQNINSIYYQKPLGMIFHILSIDN